MTVFEFIVIFNIVGIHFWIFVIAGLVNKMLIERRRS